MQNAQRCWQPSWTFRNARDRPLIRPISAASTARARAMSVTWTRSATTPSSRSASRCLSPLPTTRSTSGIAATSLGLVCAQHPVTTSVAPSLTRAARRIIWRSENSARAVTVHVLTTTTSAGSSKATVRKPRASSAAWICCVSTWLRRHPSVANETVRPPASATDRRLSALPQLAARGADVFALAPADGRGDAGVEQHPLEGQDPRQRRPPERRAFPVVERDQVDLGPNAAEKPGETVRVVHGVVHVLEHDVLEEHSLPRGQRIALDGCHERGQVEGPVHRHEPLADLVGGGVQRDRQVHLEILAAELLDPGDEADRGHGDPPWRVCDAELRIGENPQRLHQRGVVRQRLVNVLEHAVGLRPPLSEEPVFVEYLPEDLVLGDVLSVLDLVGQTK